MIEVAGSIFLAHIASAELPPQGLVGALRTRAALRHPAVDRVDTVFARSVMSIQAARHANSTPRPDRMDLKNENTTYLPRVVGELKNVQSTSSDVEQKLLDVLNGIRKGRVVLEPGHEVSPSLEKSLNRAGPGNKDLVHR